jgi:DNA polymerase-3 subunit beta
MKISVEKESLLKAIQRVINIISSRSTLPVLGNILFEAENDQLKLTTTDFEIRITTQLKAKIEREGKTTIPAKKIFSLVSRFISNEVVIDCDSDNHIEVVCGTSNFKLNGIATDDFPESIDFSANKELKFKEKDLSRMLEQIVYAVSLDDTRKVLHGVLFSIKENTVTVVATDGKRLALVEKVPESFNGTDGDIIIPLKTALEIKRLMDGGDDVLIKIGDKQISFTTALVNFTSKLIEGTYPNYRQVIPAAFSKGFEINRQMFLAKLELVSLALTDFSSCMIVSFDNNRLSFEASSTTGEGRDYIEVEYTDSKVDISFNPSFLADPFKHGTADKFKFKFNDGFSPIAIVGDEGFLYVIMPMRNR